MEGVFQFWQNVTRKTKALMPLQVFAAQVEEVDEKKRTCRVKVNEGVSFEDVRLYGLTDEGLKGFCLIPKRDSMVLVSRIDNGNELYVTMFSEVDKVLGTIGDKTEVAIDEESLLYKIEETEVALKSNDVQVKTKGVTFTVSDKKVTLDADEIVFNGGENGGLVKIKELTDKINGFIKKFNGHTHTIPLITTESAAGKGTAENVPVPAPAQTNQASELKKSPNNLYPYEDPKVKH